MASKLFEWQKDSGDYFDHYEISKDGGVTWINNGTNTSYDWIDINTEGSYSFKVRAINVRGEYSNEIEWTFDVITPPPPYIQFNSDYTILDKVLMSNDNLNHLYITDALYNNLQVINTQTMTSEYINSSLDLDPGSGIVVDDYIYMNGIYSTNRYLYKLQDMGDHVEVIYKYNPGIYMLTSAPPLINKNKDTIYMGGCKSICAIGGINTTTPYVKWNYSITEDDDQEMIMQFLCIDNYLFFIDRSNGKMRCLEDNGSSYTEKYFITLAGNSYYQKQSYAIGSDKTIYLSDNTMNTTAVDLLTGNIKWVFPNGASPVINSNNYIIVNDLSNMYVLEDNGSSYTIKSTYTINCDYALGMGKCIDNNDIVYFLNYEEIYNESTHNPNNKRLFLCGLNTNTNQLVFNESFIPIHFISPQSSTSLIISNGDILFANTAGGAIGKFKMSDFQTITYGNTPWPTNYKNNNNITTYNI